LIQSGLLLQILQKFEYKNNVFKKYIIYKCKNADQKSQLNDQFKLLKNEVTSLSRESIKKNIIKHILPITKKISKRFGKA
jgi:hypothetical protein